MKYWVLWTALLVTTATSLARAACGGNYTHRFGTFRSPGFSFSYPNSQHCIYNIQVLDNMYLSLRCPFVRIEKSKGCTKDYLKINGNVYCGRFSLQKKYFTKQLTVEFVSDASTPGRGFLCYYRNIRRQTPTATENEGVALRASSCNRLLELKSKWRGGWDGYLRIPVSSLTKTWKLDIYFSLPITSFRQWTGAATKHSNKWFSVARQDDYIHAGGKLTLDFLYTFDASKGEPVIEKVKLDGVDVCCHESGCGRAPGCPSAKYNYDEVLQKSLLFYEAQRSGRLPSNNRVPWRRDSATDDAIDHDTHRRVDLEGGYYDAGDYVKFGYPMASSATILAWGAIDYARAYNDAGEMRNMLAAVRWATDYFMKAHPEPFVFYGQVGDPDLDHKSWGRPEDMKMARPAFKITKRKPGSDLAGETAAALASASILFKRSNSRYSGECLRHAKELYEFANQYRGKYSDSIPAAAKAYKSYGVFYDELAWAAAWLYRATNDGRYLRDAKAHYNRVGPWSNEFSWADKMPGVMALLAEFSDAGSKPTYRKHLEKFCDRTLSQRRTPKGLYFGYVSFWGSLRHAANVAYICFRAADLGIKKNEYRRFGMQQIHYMLGSTGRSFVVGFGKNPPQRPHHRSSSCRDPPTICDWDEFHTLNPNPHVLQGALVGGPDENDRYWDDRKDYKKNEVACDYNAGFQSAVAALRSLTDCSRAADADIASP